MQQRLISHSVDDLTNIAKEIVKNKDDRIIAFFGQMGAGKTTFIKTFCQLLEVTDNVTSPTFSIINEYRTKKREMVYHFDFYRMKNLSEILDLGTEDYFYSGNYCLIEWPEIIGEMLPDHSLKVQIEVDEKTGDRFFSF